MGLDLKQLTCHNTVAVLGKLRPLTKDDFRRARTLDIKKDLVDLYPGTGGPMESEKNKKLDRNINHVKPSLPWPSGVIPYTTSSGFSTNEYASIAKAIAYIESETCLEFQQTNYYSKKPRIDIISKNLGGFCKAYKNYFGGGWTVELSPNSGCLKTRTIVHELLHAGISFHTAQRKDRDKYVTIQWNNIRQDKIANFDKCYDCPIYNKEYDCDSVMHYASDQMSMNRRDTIKAKNPRTCRLMPFSQWNVHEPVMSPLDIQRIKKMFCPHRG